MPPSYTIDESKVVTRRRMLLRVERERRGRNSRKVRRTETFSKLGRELRIPVITTMKSSQFQASLR